MKKSLFLINISKRTRKGFTLIEVLIVVLIIGILAAIALPQYQLARDKAKFSTYQSLVKTIADAQRRYYLITGVWTGQLANLDIDLPAGGTSSNISNGTGVIYDGWYCYIVPAQVANTNATVHCGDGDYHGYSEMTANSDGVKVNNYFRCTTLESDARGTRLCKALGGILVSCGGIIYNPINGSKAVCVYIIR